MTAAIPFEGQHHAKCDRARNEPRSTDPEVQRWFERSAHERLCMDHAAAVFAVICPRCLGIAPGSAAGNALLTPRWDKRTNRVVPGTIRTAMTMCHCPEEVAWTAPQLAALHGLSEIFVYGDSRERATGIKA